MRRKINNSYAALNFIPITLQKKLNMLYYKKSC